MKIILKDVRLSFPDLFVPKPFSEGDPPRFSATFLIPKGSPQFKEIEKKILATLEEKWPNKGQAILNQIKTNANKCCWQDGDLKDYDGYEGMMSLSAHNKVRPTVLNRDKSPLVEADGKPYAGCYVDAIVELFGYDNTGKGLGASVTGVRFVRDGDAFSGGKAAGADEFEDLSDTGDSDLA